MTKWEVQHYTLCDGWINTELGEDNQPVRYATEAEAMLELQDLMCELKDAADRGDMEPYGEEEWRVQQVEV